MAQMALICARYHPRVYTEAVAPHATASTAEFDDLTPPIFPACKRCLSSGLPRRPHPQAEAYWQTFDSVPPGLGQPDLGADRRAREHLGQAPLPCSCHRPPA